MAVLNGLWSPLVAQQAAPPAEAPKNIVEPLPEPAPAWLAGYQLRYTLRVVGDVTKSTSKSIVARLPTGRWLRADLADLAVQAADGTAIPVAVLSHASTGETLIQFARHGNDVWYWVSAVNPAAPAAAAPPPMAEGIVLEVRDWAGGDLSSWNAVRDGLTKSEPVIGNAFVAEIVQSCNPARPATPKNYAVTYRGNLNIKQDGVYRFFVNSEDASFLFIDGFKVCDRPGANARLIGSIPTRSIGSELELKAGPHAIEVHHVLAENPATYGGCTLLWAPPEAKLWTIVPRDAFVHADFAHVAAVEAPGPAVAAVFDYGIDDCLVTAGGAALHLVRFEAQGDLGDEAALQWDFGDGTEGTGRSVRHVYFAAGDYTVSLSCSGPLPPFTRRVHVWAAPGAISPFSVGSVIESLAADWRKFPADRQDRVLDFLLTCDHPNRWPLVGQVAQERLKAQGLDPQSRAQLYRSSIEALGRTSRPNELQPVVAAAMAEFAKLPTLQLGIELAEATIYQRQYHDADEAARRYEAILQKHRRLEHPDMRLAAIRWGDLLSEGGKPQRAAELYKTAATLGGEGFRTSATSDAVTRGALLRVAEQKLRKGDLIETRQLLDKIELNYPEQKLEGLYRFLRAESDRFAGRYEDALRNYEVLLELRQWAGYRDRALFGIADCHARMDDVSGALEWYARLEKAFPAYYEKQKLADRLKALVARQARSQPAAAGQTARPPKFQDFMTGFEPQETEWFGKPDNFKIVRGLGIAGPHVGLLEAYPIYLGYLTYNRPLANLTPGGHYWVECWYREDLLDAVPGFNPHMYLYLYGEGTQLAPARGQGTYFLERSLGCWRKVAFALDAPDANDGRVSLGMLSVGASQIDGLSVKAVTDRELDALSNFIEGRQERE
jgi:hypothetical protein